MGGCGLTRSSFISETANRWQGKDVVECEIPDYSKPNLELYKETLMETVAETSEEFMERYFGGDTFSEAEIRAALRTNVMDGSVVPMTMGSNVLCQGIYTLLDDVVKYFPSPENKECKAQIRQAHERIRCCRKGCEKSGKACEGRYGKHKNRRCGGN